jgi:aminoglycoside phosphotransferase family enzyme/predicted kinase
MSKISSPDTPPPATMADERRSIEAIARSLGNADARAFGDTSPTPIEWIQTHISHVFLTPSLAFKLRKSVRFDFLDFSSRDRRNADCLRELELNRRLAADVYLGVASIEADESGYRVGTLHSHPSAAEVDAGCEHVVVMKRLPEGRDARSLIATGEFDIAHIRSIVAALVPFHDAHALARPAPGQMCEWRVGVERRVLDNFATMHDAQLEPRWHELVDEVREATGTAVARLTGVLEGRCRDGRIVDGHGDLHLEHVWFAHDSLDPIFVDCLEFNESLRLIDRASEIGFLAMDLDYHGRSDLGERLIERYAVVSDDFHLFSVVDFYAAYRASVRAKVAALATQATEIPHEQREAAAESAMRYLELAASYLSGRPAGTIVCMTGTVGSGKSTVARRLADRVGGVVVSTDTTRKTADLPDAGAANIYTPERRTAVYEQVLERASWPARSGRTVILDATFETAALRGLAAEWAHSLGSHAVLVRTRVSGGTARDRLAARQRSGVGDSDAGPSELEASLARYEEPDEWLAERCFTVDTESLDHEATLEAIAASVLGGT